MANFRRRVWAPAIDSAGIAKPARIYDLRSTFISNALASGLTVFEIARVAGTSVKMSAITGTSVKMSAITERCSTQRMSRYWSDLKRRLETSQQSAARNTPSRFAELALAIQIQARGPGG